jgi:RimJ/RimL family protein N-acetyltransferase
MMSIRIEDYDISMVEQIRRLFADIYPDQPDIVDRVCYDPNRHDHISTKVAYSDQEIIGQVNIFYHKNLNGNANLGFHVHPSKRGYGIATTLSNEALKDAHFKGISLFYIRTNKDNYAAIAVAKKLGFIPIKNEFAENNLRIFERQI